MTHDAQSNNHAKPQQVQAPWTPEQARALNAYQQRGWMHPFTCANRGDGKHIGESELVALESGWVCLSCDYKQDWCWDFMFNPPKNPMEELSFT